MGQNLSKMEWEWVADLDVLSATIHPSDVSGVSKLYVRHLR